MTNCAIRVPTSWCEPESLSSSQLASSHVWLNSPNTDSSNGPILKARYLMQPVFGSTAPGSLVLRVGFFAGQANADKGCPSKLSFDPAFKKYLADQAAQYGIFKGASKPPAPVLVNFTLSVGVPTEYGQEVYANVASRMATFVDAWGRGGASPYPAAVGPDGREIGWKSVLNEAVVLLASDGAFDTASSSSLPLKTMRSRQPVSNSQAPLPLTPPTTPERVPLVPCKSPATHRRSGTVDVRPDSHEHRLDNHEDRITTCEDSIEAHQIRINHCDDSIADHEERLNTHEDHLIKHDSQITKLHASGRKFTSLWEAAKADRAAAAKRNAKQDKHIDTLNTSRQQLSTGLKDVMADVASHGQRITRTEKTVDSLKNGQEDMSSSIAKLASSKSGLESAKYKKRLDSVVAETSLHRSRLDDAGAGIQATVDRTTSHSNMFNDLKGSVGKLRERNEHLAERTVPAMSERIDHAETNIDKLKKSTSQGQKVGWISNYLEAVRADTAKGLGDKADRQDTEALEHYIDAVCVDAAKGLKGKASKKDLQALERYIKAVRSDAAEGLRDVAWGSGQLGNRVGIDFGQSGFVESKGKGKEAQVQSDDEGEDEVE